MKIKLVLFAAAKELMGSDSIEFTLRDAASLGELKQSLIEQHPSLLELVEKSTFSVDREYARDEKLLYHGAEVGFIPPVSGG
jgi:molybdopterin converting factor subunit 1